MKAMIGVLLVVVGMGACSSSGQRLLAGDTSPDVMPDGALSDASGDIQDSLQPDGAAVDADDSGGLPDGCCTTDAQCGEEQRCLGAGPGGAGRCVTLALEAGQCWEESDCKGLGPCLGVGPEFLPPVVNCAEQALQAGMCKGYLPECCWSDAECEVEGENWPWRCVGLESGQFGGICMPAPDSGQCYTAADCAPQHTCIGAAWCDCGVDCDIYYEGPGVCVSDGSNCCVDDAQCSQGQECVGGKQAEGKPGSCKSAPGDGQCWDDSQCGEAEKCVGAMQCPCDALCDMEDQPGQCVAADGCCFVDSMCAAGQVCVGATPGGGAGVCADVPGVGQCWDSAQCSEGLVCMGAQVHGCEDPAPLLPGTCGVPPECCTLDEQCGDGLSCAQKPGAGGLGVCLEAPADGACWDDEECPGGMCDGEEFCGCGEVCLALGINHTGVCVWPVLPCGTALPGAQGLGKPCPGGDDDCSGEGASMCSSGVLSDPSLTAICTTWCSGAGSCPPGSFCIDKGWSSICVPEGCAEPFLASCVSKSDCAIATATNQCCACPKAVTRAQLAMDPCLIELGSNELPPEECAVDCTGVLCQECAEVVGVKCAGNKCQAL